ncbi:ABC transporter substrate-binding protein [Gorillibacterium massiliense]|uniref:ABC transporter substrate-binding protein n=1 Tax=Gorillibacterium massiliense TaxID=1280390 RepID=UPI0004B0E547|nr:ABC transporter substrate-binding protein [Gorillibacterium massiliense]
MLAATLRFMELNVHFAEKETGKPFPVTISQLAEVWHCTPRYVKQVIHHLRDMGWIDWEAGQGRGNPSVLTLKTDRDDLLLDEAKQRIEQGQVQEAMELLNRFGTGFVRERFMGWLSEGMGFSNKTVSDKLQDTLRLPVYRTIQTLDPARVYYGFDSHLASQIFNTLVKYDRDSRLIQPCIAHSWEQDASGKVWTFHLKKGISFHHGRELTAEDAVFSLERIRLGADRFESSWMFRDVVKMEGVDEKTLRIFLREPNFLFLRFLSTVQTGILPADLVEGDERTFWDNPSGTGPFRLSRLNQGICVMEAFRDHFQGRPQLDRVEILLFPDLDEGSLKEPDWTSVMSCQGDARVARSDFLIKDGEDCEWCKEETYFACSSMLVFNQQKKGPQNDPLFREALHQIIDRKRLIAELGEDRIYPAYGFRSHPEEGFPKDAEEENYLSRDEIRNLLAASHNDGEPFHLSANDFHKGDAFWIERQLKEYGINMSITLENYENQEKPGGFQYDGRIYGVSLQADEVGELEVYLQNNYFFPAYDGEMAEKVWETAEAVYREPDEKKRKAHLKGLESRIRRENRVLFLAHKKSSTAFHKSVRGVNINEFGWLDFDKIWFHPSQRKS